jgi:hypothetical protein
MFLEEEQLLTPILIHYLNQPIEAIFSGDFQAANKNVRKGEIRFILDKNKAPIFCISISSEGFGACFLVEDCQIVEGEVSVDDLKRIKAFYSDPRSQVVLKKIWLIN